MTWIEYINERLAQIAKIKDGSERALRAFALGAATNPQVEMGRLDSRAAPQHQVMCRTREDHFYARIKRKQEGGR
jgi:hypothetical protein